MVPTVYYVALSAILFALGVAGVLIRRNAIIIFMSVELMLNSANLAFVAFARQFQESVVDAAGNALINPAAMSGQNSGDAHASTSAGTTSASSARSSGSTSWK